MSKPHPLAVYLADCRSHRATGAVTPETSLYGPLENLLNSAGAGLKPTVRAFMNMKNVGGNMPDGGLFTYEQYSSDETEAPVGQLPSRGAIECKKPKDDLLAVADSPQVSRYWNAHSQVLVTNYREFLLLGRDDEGKRVRYEHFKLVDSEKEFWSKDAGKIVADLGEPFLDFLKRCLLRPAPITEPKAVAWFLASYAREAKARVERSKAHEQVASVRAALEESLGLHANTTEGEQFFQSTLVQTLFYGLFSAWVLWHRSKPKAGEKYDWEKASKYLHVPVLRKLFREMTDPGDLDDWNNLTEVMMWAGEVFNRVDRGAFFAKFEDEHAVQYFYEPFLEQFDPELRKKLGVWYTPPEIVQYMVARVDAVLKSDFNLPLGLADESVYILDPCCGTGAYLVEVLRRIEVNLKSVTEDSKLGIELKTAATDRVFGFEILPAPFVIAHLQIGMHLQSRGAAFEEKDKARAAVYLTNALTGWSPPTGAKQQLQFPELEEERHAADEVKRGKPILVVLGNPPYNAYAGVSTDQEDNMIAPYKSGLVTSWGIKKFNLDDLYTRFFRIADRCVGEGALGRGLFCYISNFSYLSEPSFVVMRQQLSERFDRIWIDCLNGDSRETGKLTPEGLPDPSVFSTETNRAGIRVGTAIGLFARTGSAKGGAVRFREFWGKEKRAEILASLGKKAFARQYDLVRPSKLNRYSFVPNLRSAEYDLWPRVIDLCALPPSNGLMEKRGGALIDTDAAELETRMRVYFDRNLDWGEYKAVAKDLVRKQASFDPKLARKRALAREQFQAAHLVKYAVRPFDSRWCYYTDSPSIWNRARSFLWNQCWDGNSFLITRPAGVVSEEGVPVSYTTLLGDNDYQRGHSYYFPMLLKNGARLDKKTHASLFDSLDELPGEDLPFANLSAAARDYLRTLNANDPDRDVETAKLIWRHSLAIGVTPKYLAENASGLKGGWPRIPLPKGSARLQQSAELGAKVAALLDTEPPTMSSRKRTAATESQVFGLLSKIGGSRFKPESDFAVTAHWGIAGKGGICMPSYGKALERAYTPEEFAAIGDGVAQLGETTFDIYLNDAAYWKNVPKAVWEYTLGGYQVLKKWLSYREFALLGRALRLDEVEYFQQVVRRIAALRLLGPALDANYEAVKADLFSWPQKTPG